jgi:gliding motility-associated-like protein
MYYECIGDNQYQFTMKLYRDCNSSGAFFDNPATFAVFNEANALLFTQTSSVGTIEEVNTDLDNPCIAVPPNICVEEGTYTFVITFPDANQTYQVVYQRCCRNQTIQNLVNPGAQGLTIVATVPPSDLAVCNSSPSFNNFPPPVLCAQETLIFDHSATDPDGDSLVYSLCSPYIGGTQDDPMPVPPSNPPYAEVSWGGGASATNPITGAPGLSINPVTGMLIGVPTVLGQYVVGVCVEEWRDGQLLSTNTRDFQFNVAFCEQPSQALVAQPEIDDLCQGLTFTFQNESNPDNVFVWDFGDPTTDDDVSNIYSPTYTFPDTGVYTVMLVTNPDFFCSDTFLLNLPLFYEVSVEITSSAFECENGLQVFSFSSDGEFDQVNSTVIWDFGPNGNPSTSEGINVSDVSFTDSGDQEVTVSVLNNVCTAVDEVELNVVPAPTAEITPQSIFCNGLNYAFSQQSTNATQYIWDFGVSEGDDDQSTQTGVNFTFPEPGSYTVSLTAWSAGNCPVTTTEVFDIRPLLDAEIEPVPVQCFDNNSVDFEAAGSYTSNASFSWQFENALPEVSTAENPQDLFFLEPGIHDVMITISENGCTRSDSIEVIVHENPYADFEASPLSGCAPLDVNFFNNSFSQSSNVAYEWDFGDGNLQNSRAIKHMYVRPGTYTVSLYLENLSGCIDSDQMTKEALIEVLPTPQAGFKIDPIMLSVIDPRVEITDASIGGTSCAYVFDEQEFLTCDFEHLLNNVVPQPIRQTVFNEYGCFDTAEGEIFISDHMVYIPNSFTPDGDGLNEIFAPVMTGVVQYEMHITDRWGRVVYSNTNVERGWDGSGMDGEYYTQAGLYHYLIRVTDNLGWNFDYTGTITLLR